MTINWEDKLLSNEPPPRKTIYQILRERPIKLELGGGKSRTGGYINVDIREEYPEVDFVCDVATLEHFPDGSVDAILAKDVLQCFHRDEVGSVLRTWYRKLRKNSRIVVQVPDAKQLFSLYAADKVCSCWDSGSKKGREGCPKCDGKSEMNYDKFLTYLYGRNRNYEMNKNAYDLPDLSALMERAGFTILETQDRELRFVIIAKKLIKKEV